MIAAEDRQIGMVFQSYAVWPHLTVFENVAYPLRVRRAPGREIDRQVNAALQTVQMEHLATRFPAQLSGGQQQRVALARALVNRPRVLLLDEPLGALDLKLRKEMQIELTRIQQQVGITFIYVTHDQGEALAMSDRIAVMSEGVIEQMDAPAEIYDRPLTAFVADFIGEMNFLQGEVTRAVDGEFDLRTGSGVVVRARGEATTGHAARVGIRPSRVRIAGPATEGAVNTARAVVATRIYLGDEVQVVAELEGGTQFIVREQRAGTDDAHDAIRPGDPITIQWEHTAPVLLADPPAPHDTQNQGGTDG
jgi:spermidine/putrescine transport system ATP-binding protein